MEYAIIVGEIVANVIVADASFVATSAPGAIRIDNISPVPGIGWKYSGSTFTPPVSATAPLVTGTHGSAISPVSASARGGTGTGFTFAATGLPTGLSMSSSGEVSGAPAGAGTSTYAVTVTDSGGNIGSAAGTVTIS
jgi:hypothetical protein